MKIIKKKKIADESVVVPFPSLITGSFFYVGMIPAASGTFGSIAALVVTFFPVLFNVPAMALLTAAAFAAGVISSPPIIRRYGDDPSVIVIDEVAGMWTALTVFLAFGNSEAGLIQVAICFVAFRFFDIVKIQPAKYFDGLKSPAGVMMDDIVAGIYGGAAAVLISYIFPDM